jgi:uncharacterized protein YdeI (YjbR/CyaY-like superfamily)
MRGPLRGRARDSMCTSITDPDATSTDARRGHGRGFARIVAMTARAVAPGVLGYAPTMPKELPELLVVDAAALRAWLLAHHARSTGVWLVLHKKGGAITTLTYAQALDEALCFGWIDGQVRTRDAHSYLQRFTPRTAKSRWSARNVTHVARLEASGKMHASGRAAVDAAKADGRWDEAYASPANATVPDDLAAAIAANGKATQAFAGLSAQNRFALIYRLGTVKRAETRTRKVAEMVAMLARGETFHPQAEKKRARRA